MHWAGVRLKLGHRSAVLVRDDAVAHFHAFIADEDRRPGDQFLHVVLRLVAEGAFQNLGGRTGAVVALLPAKHHAVLYEIFSRRGTALAQRAGVPSQGQAPPGLRQGPGTPIERSNRMNPIGIDALARTMGIAP